MDTHDRLFATINDLVMRHSPSGVEGEVDEMLLQCFEALGVAASVDPAGNLVARIPGQGGGGKLAITAHKDEIGAIVTRLEDEGRVRVRRLGGSAPWIYGEGLVDLLGDSRCVTGVLSFGSRHITHAGPANADKSPPAPEWSGAWIETRLTPAELAEAGVRVGTRMVVSKHRKAPYRLKDCIASYTLDNKASVAILLELARRVKKPQPDVYLVATAKEEVGAVGALYFTQHEMMDALIALEICPLAPEYPIKDGTSPVLVVEDNFCVYDDLLNETLRRAAACRGIPLQLAILSTFGSDASFAMKEGHVARASCLGFPAQNTHGYEIARLGAIEHCIDILETVCQETFA